MRYVFARTLKAGLTYAYQVDLLAPIMHNLENLFITPRRPRSITVHAGILGTGASGFVR